MLNFKVIIIALSGILSLTACGTIEGAGRDIESVGDAIADEAAD